MLPVFFCVWRSATARAARWIVWLVLACAGGAVGTAQTELAARWKYTTTGVVVSSPAVDRDGNIYVGVSLGNRTGRLLALTRAGAKKWSNFPDDGLPLPNRIEGAPVIGPGGEIYIGSLGGILYGFNASGTKVLEYTYGASVPAFYGSAAVSPEGVIYIGASDADINNSSGHVVGVSPGGVEIFRSKRLGGIVRTSPAIGPDGSVYIGCDDGNIYGLNRDLSERWRKAADRVQDSPEPIYSSPAIGADGTVYIGAGIKWLYALNPADGSQKWRFDADDYIGATPVLGADGTIYVGTTGGMFYAIDPRNGAKKWEYNASQQIWSSAVVRGDGSVIFGTDADPQNNFQGRVIALMPGERAPTVLWTYHTDDHVTSSPVVDKDGFIYVGSDDRKLHALPGNGSPVSAFSAWPAFQHDAQRTGHAGPRVSGGKLINLSTRALAGPEVDLIAGFVVQGTVTKSYLVRGVGPSLIDFGLTNFIPDPTVSVFPSGALTPIAFNNDWGDPVSTPAPGIAAPIVGAFPLHDGSTDAAVVPLLSSGTYTAQVRSNDARSGTALAEIYDARPDAPGSTLLNLSTLAQLTSNTELISGLVVDGGDGVRVLVRAVGPSLNQFPIAGAKLARPALRVIRQDGVVLYANANWTAGGLRGDISGAGALVGAFPFVEPTAASNDSALVATLPPGQFTIQVIDQNGTQGYALVEVYLLP